MPPKRGKRPAEAEPVILGSNSDQQEVLQWLRRTVQLPGGMVDKVRCHGPGAGGETHVVAPLRSACCRACRAFP